MEGKKKEKKKRGKKEKKKKKKNDRNHTYFKMKSLSNVIPLDFVSKN